MISDISSTLYIATMFAIIFGEFLLEINDHENKNR